MKSILSVRCFDLPVHLAVEPVAMMSSECHLGTPLMESECVEAPRLKRLRRRLGKETEAGCWPQQARRL